MDIDIMGAKDIGRHLSTFELGVKIKSCKFKVNDILSLKNENVLCIILESDDSQIAIRVDAESFLKCIPKQEVK
jgi:hypothetical protein